MTYKFAILANGCQFYSGNYENQIMMNLRDKMTPKTDEQLYEALKKLEEPTLIIIVFFYNCDQLYLIEKLIDDPTLEPEVKEKWIQLLNTNAFQKIKKLDGTKREILVNAMKDADMGIEEVWVLLIEPDFYPEIEERFAQVVDDFFYE